jgi:hypothetical protein
MANGWTPEMLEAMERRLNARRILPGTQTLGRRVQEAFRCPECGGTRATVATGQRWHGDGHTGDHTGTPTGWEEPTCTCGGH